MRRPARNRAAQRLLDFVVVERERLATRDSNIFGAFTGQINDLLGYLEIIAAEYDEAAATFNDLVARRIKAATSGGAGPRAVTSEESALMEELYDATQVLHLRIETFYLWAKILLDKIARFVPHYFGPGRGVKLSGHSGLGAALPKIANQKGLTPIPQSITSKIGDLSCRISDYRDHKVTHAYSPRTLRGTTFNPERGEATIASAVLYPREDSEVGTSSETPRTLLPEIESYVVEIVDYLQRNRDKTTLRLRA